MFDEEISDTKLENKLRLTRFLEALTNSTSIANLDKRAEDAYTAAIRFMELLEESIDNQAELEKLKVMWFKAVRYKEYKKFKKSLARYNNEKK